jgi:hypothetical protein
LSNFTTLPFLLLEEELLFILLDLTTTSSLLFEDEKCLTLLLRGKEIPSELILELETSVARQLASPNTSKQLSITETVALLNVLFCYVQLLNILQLRSLEASPLRTST